MESGRYCRSESLCSTASFTDTIGASKDPVALDYWASKNIFMPAAEYRNHSEYSSLDADYEPTSPTGPGGRRFMVESVHNYLERSTDALESAGLQVTMNLDEMNVNVTSFSGTTVPTIVPGNPHVSLAIILPVSVALVVIAVVIAKRKASSK